MVASSASSIRSIRRKPYPNLMLSESGNSLGPREREREREKALPATPLKQLIDPVIQDGDPKNQSPTQLRLNELGTFLIGSDVERSLATLTSQHINLSHVMNNLESLLRNNGGSDDSFARSELENKLEQVKRERSGVEKQKMEVGILITRVRRKLDLIDGRGDGDSFLWSKKWGSEGMK
jgi:hypothetical protein